MPIGDGSHELIPVIHQIIHYLLDIQYVTNDGLIQVRFGFIQNLPDLCTRFNSRAIFDMLRQTTHTDGRRDSREK